VEYVWPHQRHAGQTQRSPGQPGARAGFGRGRRRPGESHRQRRPPDHQARNRQRPAQARRQGNAARPGGGGRQQGPGGGRRQSQGRTQKSDPGLHAQHSGARPQRTRLV
ncbi:MAG: Nucleoid-associated protein YaaK, partial [uncultured Cytophagales bacterium]